MAQWFAVVDYGEGVLRAYEYDHEPGVDELMECTDTSSCHIGSVQASSEDDAIALALQLRES